MAGFERVFAASTELRHALDEVAQLWTLFSPGSGVLALSATASGLAALTAAADKSRFFVLRFSFESVKLHKLAFVSDFRAFKFF